MATGLFGFRRGGKLEAWCTQAHQWLTIVCVVSNLVNAALELCYAKGFHDSGVVVGIAQVVAGVSFSAFGIAIILCLQICILKQLLLVPLR